MTITESELTKQVEALQRQLAETNARLDRVVRVFRASAHLAVDTLLEPPAPSFD